MPETKPFGGVEEGGGQFTTALQPNTVLAARYRILAQLGGGGQGAVYQARDLNFPEARRLVAVKEMQVSTNDPTLREQSLKSFQREANILATLSHPAIPRIYDFFERDDRAYVVMEYINGSDLEALLIKTKSLPMDKIVDWAIELCDVLEYLHNYKPEPIIFRDMKPSNIMIDSLGHVRLIDFGIAKVFVSGMKQTTIGTEGYSAPEQYRGEANPLSDIYGLGASLHHVITRKDPRLEPPFSFSERRLKDINPQVPDGMQEILDRALSFEKDSRYSAMSEMKADLERMKFGQYQAAPPPPPPQNHSPQQGIATTGLDAQIGMQPPPAAPQQPQEPRRVGRTGFIEDPSDEYLGGIRPKWTFKAEDEIRSRPIVYRNAVYLGSYDTSIYAIALEDGSFLWKFATEGGLASAPVIDEAQRSILFGSEDGTYYALDYRMGRVNWKFKTKGKIRSTGQLAHGHVFFGSDDGHVYALLSGDGRHMWSFDTESPVRTTPFVTNNRIIVGNQRGEVIGLELNGQKAWTYRVRKEVTSSPVVDDDGICYFGSFDTTFYAIDAEGGFSHWRIRINAPIIGSPVLDATHAYFGAADGKLYCINTYTGREEWNFDTGKPIVASPILHKGYLYVGGTNGKLYCVNPQTGKERWSFQTENSITAPPFITESLILVGSMDRTLYALPLVD